MEARVAARAQADRGVICAVGGAWAQSGVPPWAAERMRAEERLAVGRVVGEAPPYAMQQQQGWARTLLARRSRTEKLEHAFYLCYAPTAKSTLALPVRVTGQRRVGGAARQRRKKLSMAACVSAYPRCAICAPVCCGTENIACNVFSTGPTGIGPTNSWPTSTTTENANPPCPIASSGSYLLAIYNCSTKAHRSIGYFAARPKPCPFKTYL